MNRNSEYAHSCHGDHAPIEFASIDLYYMIMEISAVILLYV